MPNPEHLAILKQGAEVWNRWRDRQRPKSSPFSDEQIRAFSTGEFLATAIMYDFSGADLSHTNLEAADLTFSDLSFSKLRRSQLSHVVMNNSDLTAADLLGADLTFGQLSGCCLKHGRPFAANLSHSHLYKTDFTNALMGLTVFGALDLSAAIGLDTVLHEAPSIVDVRTLNLSRLNLPTAFLRNAGVADPSDWSIQTADQKPKHFYSCFISYSTIDEMFAQHLYTDLRTHGVECWIASEDLKIGDSFRQRIEEAIRIHQKLLVILTEHSVKSSWVESEVESAMEKERRDDSLVLFPIRLDDAVLETNASWAANIRRTRHIGNFCNWRDANAYQQAFDRLVRDLSVAAQAKRQGN